MAACGNFAQQHAPASGGDCEDCVQVVKSMKKVSVPCHRNTYKQYTVRVPRQVTEQKPRTVNYTEMEDRQKQVPYTVNRCEKRMRVENQTYQVPVQKTVTRMVSVTRKVPKTVYVDVTTQVPKQECITNMETRTRQVKIPYNVNVPETRYRTEHFKHPVQKTKTVMDTIQKTVFDTQIRTRCVPQTTYVTKEIPVYNVVARPRQPCPPEQPCGPCEDNSGNNTGAPVSAEYQQEFNSIDANNDGMISAQEYAAARQAPAAAGHGHVEQQMIHNPAPIPQVHHTGHGQ